MLKKSRLSLNRQTIVIALLLLLTLVAFYDRGHWPFNRHTEATGPGVGQVAYAYENQISNIQVEGVGVVAALLNDDTQGTRHQRFILRLDNGQSILIAHNIDLAPRLDSIKQGDRVAFSGEYEWNEKGGVVHWTHHDPANKHVDGWLKHNSRLYR